MHRIFCCLQTKPDHVLQVCVCVCVCVLEDDLKQETLPMDKQAAGRVTVLLNTSMLHPECVPSIVKLYCTHQHLTQREKVKKK